MSKDEAMKAMARRVCAQIVEGDSDNPLRVMKANRYLNGSLDDDHHMAIAVAAIMETQRLDAELADNIANVGVLDPGGIGWVVAEKIRTGEHYALAGDRREPSNLHKAQNAPAHLLTPESDPDANQR